MILHNDVRMERVAKLWHLAHAQICVFRAASALGAGWMAFAAADWNSPIGRFFAGLAFCSLASFAMGILEAIFHLKGARDHAGNITNLEKSS